MRPAPPPRLCACVSSCRRERRRQAPVATGQVDEASSAAARLLNEEESYWQTATGGDSSEPDAEQPSDTESGDNATPRQRIGAEAEQFLAISDAVGDALDVLSEQLFGRLLRCQLEETCLDLLELGDLGGDLLFRA